VDKESLSKQIGIYISSEIIMVLNQIFST